METPAPQQQATANQAWQGRYLRVAIVSDGAAAAHKTAGGEVPSQALQQHSLARPWRPQQQRDTALQTARVL